ncbi:hypothetical protein Ocin01_16369 [Orchesella cincta]|uniref:F-box domain-containing protein n=1 Tax=Orchesella cincta TaxID=48709 RepID=A0A1D2MBL6_ORCCI|nr:hypothetical protein Ocin01_16369 [Orchesella cincta]
MGGFTSGVVVPQPPKELPAEVIEMILPYLHGDRKSMLKCRLVSPYWRGAIDSYLERKCLSNWTKWNPSEKSQTKGLQLFPVLPISNESGVANPRLLFVQSPLGLTKHNGNPFVTRSLTVSNIVRPWTYRDKYYVSSVKLEKLIKNFGFNLTTFVLHDTTVTLCQLDSMLKQLMNLKALTFSSLNLRKSWKDAELSRKKTGTELAQFVPQLTNVRAVDECPSQVIQWIVDQTGHRLQNLEVDASSLNPFQPKQASLDESITPETIPCKQLTHLKALFPNPYFLRYTEPFPLQYLSLLSIPIDFEYPLSFILKFIDNFSSTLVHLHLDADIMDLDKEEMENLVTAGSAENPLPIKLSEIKYPKLRNFDIRIPSRMNTGFEVVKRHILPKFPMLEHFRLLPLKGNSAIPHDDRLFKYLTASKPERLALLAQERLKSICPKLTSVSLWNLHAQF